METRRALYIFGACGAISLLVDLDHLISLILWRYWFPTLTEGRIWHAPLLVLVGIAICSLCAYLGRLYYKFILVGGIVVIITVLVLVYSPLVVWGLTK